MSSHVQTFAALALVLLALGYLGWRNFVRKKTGGSCGCGEACASKPKLPLKK